MTLDCINGIIGFIKSVYGKHSMRKLGKIVCNSRRLNYTTFPVMIRASVGYGMSSRSNRSHDRYFLIGMGSVTKDDRQKDRCKFGFVALGCNNLIDSELTRLSFSGIPGGRLYAAYFIIDFESNGKLVFRKREYEMNKVIKNKCKSFEFRADDKDSDGTKKQIKELCSCFR